MVIFWFVFSLIAITFHVVYSDWTLLMGVRNFFLRLGHLFLGFIDDFMVYQIPSTRLVEIASTISAI